MRKYSVLFLLILSASVFAQTLVQTTYTTPSSVATGRLATAVPTADLGMINENPAYGGLFARNISFVASSSFNQEWKVPVSDLKHYNYGFFVGLDLRDRIRLPLSISFSYYRNYYDFGEQANWLSSFVKDSYETSDLFSVSAAFNWPVKLSLGVTYKKYFVQLTNDFDADFTGWDIGMIAQFPIHRLIPDSYRIYKNKKMRMWYDLDYMLGFSLRNLGDKYYFVDEAQSDPLYRELNAGHSLTFSFNVLRRKRPFTPLSATVGIDVHESLAQNSADADYKSIPGSIRFVDNFLLGQGDSQVAASKGYIIRLMETFSYFGGSQVGMDMYSSLNMDGFGYMLETSGLFNILDCQLRTRFTGILVKHLNFKYYYAERYKNGPFQYHVNYFQLELKNLTSFFI